MEERYKVGYVILHFNSIDDTYDAIESVKDLLEDDDIIIVVDNCSKNGTGKVLQNHYEDDKRVDVVLNEKNLGFAKGNNVGIGIALNHYACDFIVVMNNDVVIEQKEFRKHILDAYRNYAFAVLGPQVRDSSGWIYTSNPRKEVFTKHIHVIRGIILNLARLILTYLGFAKFVYKLECRLNENKSKSKKIEKNKNTESKNSAKESSEHKEEYVPNCERIVENMRIHGCCFVLSRRYTDLFPGLNPQTFLYLEEDILYNRCRNNDLKILYYPNAVIVHKGQPGIDSGTDKASIKAKCFKYKKQFGSFLVLYGEISKKKIK